MTITFSHRAPSERVRRQKFRRALSRAWNWLTRKGGDR